MKSIVACVLEQFSLRYAGDAKGHPGLVVALTLRMEGGLPMKVTIRE
jgi:hypothetical protein